MSGSSTQNASARITLESLKEPNEIPYLQWNSRNVWFILGCGGFAGLLAREIGLGLSAITLTAFIGLYLGFDFVRSTPPYANATEWIKTNIAYWRQPSEFANTAEAHVETDSTIRAAIQTPESTRELTGVSRLYPPHGIIEREDGSYSMMLRYTPPNQDFNTKEEFLHVVNTLENGYNEIADFDIVLHSTTRPVNMERYFNKLAERMDDDDVQQNEIFKALLQEMKEHRKQMLEETQTEVTHFYLIVSVNESEAKDEIGGDDDAQDRSRIFNRLAGGRSHSDETGDPDKRKQRRLKKILDDRAKKVEKILIESSGRIEDANIKKAPVTEAGSVFETYWTGRQVPLDPDEREAVPVTRTTRGPPRTRNESTPLEGSP